MDSHGLDMRGKLKVERVSTLPTWSSSDIGREIYVVDEGKKYYGGSSDWVNYGDAEYATDIEDYLYTIPLNNYLPDNGRFSGLTPGSYYLCDNTNDPFAQGNYFYPYNSGSIAECGKFIYSNTDYGGIGGSMTQTTIDLLETMQRTEKRYGVEFRIAQLTAGTGTAASYTFSFGTKYLMSTNTGANFGVYAYNSVGMWLRCTSGSVGLRNNIFPYCTMDGVISNTEYELTSSDNWIFYFYNYRTTRGYSNGDPRFYGTSGTVLQIALPAVFTGAVRGAYWEAPIVSNWAYGT